MQNRNEKIKLIAGRIMRGPMATATEATEADGNPHKIMRAVIERAVAAGLAYRDNEDAQVPLDIAEADALVAEWQAALEDEEGGDREISAGVEMAEFIERLSSEAKLAFGTQSEEKK